MIRYFQKPQYHFNCCKSLRKFSSCYHYQVRFLRYIRLQQTRFFCLLFPLIPHTRIYRRRRRHFTVFRIGNYNYELSCVYFAASVQFCRKELLHSSSSSCLCQHHRRRNNEGRRKRSLTLLLLLLYHYFFLQFYLSKIPFFIVQSFGEKRCYVQINEITHCCYLQLKENPFKGYFFLHFSEGMRMVMCILSPYDS